MFKASSELYSSLRYQNNPFDFHPKRGQLFVSFFWVWNFLKTPKEVVWTDTGPPYVWLVRIFLQYIQFRIIAQVGIYSQTNCSFLWKRLDFWSYSRKSNLQTSPWNGEHQPVDEKNIWHQSIEHGSLSPLFTTCFKNIQKVVVWNFWTISSSNFVCQFHASKRWLFGISGTINSRSDEIFPACPGLRGAGGTFFMLDQLQPDQDRRCCW